MQQKIDLQQYANNLCYASCEFVPDFSIKERNYETIKNTITTRIYSIQDREQSEKIGLKYKIKPIYIQIYQTCKILICSTNERTHINCKSILYRQLVLIYSYLKSGVAILSFPI